MGMVPDVLDIYKYLPHPNKNIHLNVNQPWLKMQTMLFSATLMPNIMNFIQSLAPTHKLVNLNKEMEVADNSNFFLIFFYFLNIFFYNCNFFFIFFYNCNFVSL